MINKIKSKLTQVDYILHIADIHIRNWKRHKEYKLVFNKLFDAVDKLPPNSIVTVGGDIVHAKTDMSPELIQMVNYLFKGLADRVPTVVICGNHDTNLNNNNRLDALTPIVEATTHNNLFYLRDTDYHKIGNVTLNIMSLLDDKSKYITADKIEDRGDCLIGMYHGTLTNSKVDSGLNMSHGLDWDIFAGHDIVLLGDIHKRQILSAENPLIFYPGSLVQQNFGESYEGHGYAIVDVKAKTVEHYDIPNEYGYYTLDVEDGNMPKNLPITSKTSVRLRATNTSAAQIKKALSEIRKLYKNSEVIVQNLDKIAANGDIDLGNSIQGLDIRNVDYQTTLLSDYLQQFHLDPETTESIININKSLNSAIPATELARNVVWKPILFQFDNMFSYGEGNSIDFTKLNGTSGLFAPNHAGKSAILDALCFCLFDYSHRAGRADQVLNNKKDSFWCKFQFQINGLDYFIEKTAVKYAKGPLAGKLRVDIEFWFVNAEGERISLNGEQRKDTNRIIQTYVGSFDDFILTALSLQGSNSNFIEKTQGERKDLLANFLDLKVYDLLSELATKEIKTTIVLLEEYQKQDFEQKLGDAERSIDQLTTQYKTVQDLYNNTETEISTLNDTMVELAAKLRPNEASGLVLNTLEKNAISLQDRLVKQNQLVLDLETKQITIQNEMTEYASYLSSKNIEGIKDTYKLYTNNVDAKKQLDNTLAHYKVTIGTKLDKLKKLETHEYDPNCKYCNSNAFVKDAIATKGELEDDKKAVADFLAKRKEVDDYIEQVGWVVSEHDKLVKVHNEVEKLKSSLQLEESRLATAKSQLEVLSREIEQNQANTDLYYKNIETIEFNTKTQETINLTKRSLEAKRFDLTKYSKQLQDVHGKIKVAETVINECNASIIHMQELSDKQIAYDYYQKAVGRDGIPYILISKAIPFIQNYVNNILTQVVDFTVEIETDGKNINVFIAYDSNKWPLELASGMERFMSALAIRIALIKITNLPKPDFIAIDEGLGVLDSSNLNSMHMFFNYLKDVFKFTLVISHIDVVRDMMDTMLTIDRKDDFSYINY
jgi:DNA repair exonuclease SbcCD ATPase subunit/DNA repair exonuclease SbcCD nuclease subunit